MNNGLLSEKERNMPRIIISFTSYPKRIKMVHRVIKSIFDQTWKVDKIILYLSELEFPQKEQDLPENLKALIGANGFSVKWVSENLKSHKKYFYSLREYNDIVITIDDDVCYARTMVADLMNCYKKYPQAVLARKVHIILRDHEHLAKYQEWDSLPKQYANSPRTDLCAVGVGGILYPPHCAHSHWFCQDRIEELALDQDDLWLKFQEIADRIPTVYVPPMDMDEGIEFPLEEKLSYSNVIGGGNDKVVLELQKWMNDEYRDLYFFWRNSLSDIVTYTAEKKEYYKRTVGCLLEKNKNFPIYLYGAGKRAGQILQFLEEAKLKDKIDGILVSDSSQDPQKLQGVKVTNIKAIDPQRFFSVIYGVGPIYFPEIDMALDKYNHKRIDIDFESIQQYYL